jgi:DNA-binding response OmpR family regulator
MYGGRKPYTLWLLLARAPRHGEESYDHLPEPHAPVIVMTAAHDAATRAAEIKAAAYLGKPFHLADLYACIEHWANQG